MSRVQLTEALRALVGGAIAAGLFIALLWALEIAFLR
jgi:hypothetical protein